MKKINDSRKLMGATAATSLKELNTMYKSLMKSHHPDRFPDDERQRQEAEEFSKHLIDAYKFLESIHPETHEKESSDFEKTVASNIANWHYKSLTLHITFGDGSNYEFYSVPQKVYNKFVGTDGNTRFARRHIFAAHPFRKVSGPAVQAG